MQAVLLLIVCVLALGIGVALTWWILTVHSHGVLRRAREEATAILALAEQESIVLKEEVIRNETATFDAQRAQLSSERATLERDRESLEQLKRRSRQKNDRNRKKLNNRHRRLNKKQELLNEGTQIIEILQTESDKALRDSERLSKHLEKILNTASKKLSSIDAQKHDLDSKQSRLESLIQDRLRKLEIISDLTQDEARQHLREELLEKAQEDIALELIELQDQADITARDHAHNIVLTTMQRLASEEAESNSVSVATIPSEDVKGRVIGREGRNIQAFEAATGVDLLVDDTPGAIVISSFDPYRREIALRALNKLIQDGRIHPGTIERFVANAEKNLKSEIRHLGERTLLDLKLRGMHKELVSIVGKMKYRTSYGQNLLSHSIQVARLCSIMASEMGLNTQIARRAGLLHDIGKVLQESFDRSHALVGMDYCKRFKESLDICNAVGSHHDEIEMTSLYAPIVQICDAISGARPGARNIRRDEYIERLQDMEAIAMSFDGVTLAYAIQGGRELRVIVEYGKVSDVGTRELAVNISSRIQNELTYPGQVDVTVIRELRKTSTAK
ncbi:MAG: ribonuclease Y [Bacteroidetes bacterium]|nr:ribonuclease Y [Bacteroidota bacterium]